jgi:hypothetical protein
MGREEVQQPAKIVGSTYRYGVVGRMEVRIVRLVPGGRPMLRHHHNCVFAALPPVKVSR